jgi:hypothetical protein
MKEQTYIQNVIVDLNSNIEIQRDGITLCKESDNIYLVINEETSEVFHTSLSDLRSILREYPEKFLDYSKASEVIWRHQEVRQDKELKELHEYSQYIRSYEDHLNALAIDKRYKYLVEKYS